MEMKRPSFFRNYILYTASYNGKDNIYALDRTTKKIYRITSARFGASDAYVINDPPAIIYSNYTADGYNLVREDLNPLTWTQISVPEKSAFPLAEKLTEQENFIFNTDSVPENKYVSKPYSKFLNQLNIHSWAPIGIDLQNFSVAPGVTVLSQNLLGTTVTAIGYQYNRNEKTGKTYLSVSNESLYTAFDINADYGGRRDFGIYTDNDSVPEKWNELNISAGLRLPLNWTHNTWIRSFQPSVVMNYKNLKMDASVPFGFDHDQIVAVKYSLIASNEIKTSQRDIYPRWSQLLQLNYSNTPFINSSNSIFAGQLTMDFPGIGRHHGLRLYAGYQKRTEDFYPFSDIIIFPRGYTEITRDEMYSYSVTYTMPLFYPEWQIGQLMYFKRFKTSFFYDFARSNDSLLPGSFSAIGLDLTSDFSFINLIAPLDAGLRTIYQPETGDVKFELLFSLNFGGMY
jgi:hypothetical protein